MNAGTMGAWTGERRHGWRAPWVAIGVAIVATLATSCSGGPSSSAQKSSNAKALLSTAVRDLSAGKTADAVGELLTVVKIDPSNYIAWYDLGDIAQQLGEQTLAIHDYQASIHADGNYIPALFNLAIMYTSTQPTTASSLYQKAIALEPADAELHLNYGFLLLSTGSRQGGLQQLARAVELQPSLASRIPASDGGTGK